jgi:hypothetical protein
MKIDACVNALPLSLKVEETRQKTYRLPLSDCEVAFCQSPIRSKCSHCRKSPLKPMLSAIWKLEDDASLDLLARFSGTLASRPVFRLGGTFCLPPQSVCSSAFM